MKRWCLVWAFLPPTEPGEVPVRLHPKSVRFFPLPTIPFRDQVENLQAIPPDEGDSALIWCVQCTLCTYNWIAHRASEDLSSSLSGRHSLGLSDPRCTVHIRSESSLHIFYNLSMEPVSSRVLGNNMQILDNWLGVVLA